MSTTALPAPLGCGLDLRNRQFTAAFSEIAECLRDLGTCALMPASEHQVSKVAGVAAGLDRAARRLREGLLGQEPPKPPAVEVTKAMVMTVGDLLAAQYVANPEWESAKDAIEGIDVEALLLAALAPLAPRTPKTTET